MDIYNEFIAQEKDLVFYAGKYIRNKRHAFYDRNGNPWDFSDATGFTFNIWEEREGGRQMIAWTSPANIEVSTSNANEFILNAPSTDTSIERGKYYYEIEELIAGGYPILLAYGEANFL
jgi:hypothetical protein